MDERGLNHGWILNRDTGEFRSWQQCGNLTLKVWPVQRGSADFLASAELRSRDFCCQFHSEVDEPMRLDAAKLWAAERANWAMDLRQEVLDREERRAKVAEMMG